MQLPEQICVAPGWHRNDTLLHATLEQWHQADYYQALSACSFLVRAAAGLNGKPAYDKDQPLGVYRSSIDFQQGDLLDYSVILMRAVTESTAGHDPSVAAFGVDFFANTIMHQLGWLEIDANHE